MDRLQQYYVHITTMNADDCSAYKSEAGAEARTPLSAKTLTLMIENRTLERMVLHNRTFSKRTIQRNERFSEPFFEFHGTASFCQG
jgi:hypothetical protein